VETQNYILEGCRREVAITYTNAELQPYYERAYQQAQQHAQLPGFRKGKVPLAMIKKKFGKDIENESLEGIANEGFQEFVKSEDVHPIGRPMLRDIQREPDGTITFKIAYEVLPEFELASYRGLELQKPVHVVTDEEVDSEIENLTLRYGTQEDADQAVDDMHFVTVQFRALDEQTGMPLIGSEPEERVVLLKNEPASSELKASLLNTKVGDTFYHTLPAPDGSVRKVIGTINKITRLIPAELSNEFVETVTNGHLHTTEELREDYDRQIRGYWVEQANKAMNDQIVSQMLKAHDFAPPQALVQEVITNILKEEVERLPDKKLPKGFDIQRYVEVVSPMAANTAKWMIIRERLIEAENVTVEDTDIEQKVAELANLVGGNENLEYIRSLIAANDELRNRIINDKLMAILREYAVVTEVPAAEYKPYSNEVKNADNQAENQEDVPSDERSALVV
jgi:trigger factor